MAVTWTTITNAQVAAGAAVTTALMTALRDNPEGIAQRASGAPKIFGVPYYYEEFLFGGAGVEWVKPANAENGDEVFIHVVGGGAAASSQRGGGAGGGMLIVFFIEDLPATIPISAVGAGGVTNGTNGGDTIFGNVDDPWYIKAYGGLTSSIDAPEGGRVTRYRDVVRAQATSLVNAGAGNGADSSSADGGVPSLYAGYGGNRVINAAEEDPVNKDGRFPGGGGGGGSPGLLNGDGADGVVRIWCVKNQ